MLATACLASTASKTTTMASLSLLTSRPLRATTATMAANPSRLRTSFLSTSTSLSFPTASSFAGMSLGIDLGCHRVLKDRYRTLQVRAGKKYLLCQTKRSRSRKSLARVHGFRRRMRTANGRAVLKRRRAKGRKVLCTKSNPNSGKRA